MQSLTSIVAKRTRRIIPFQVLPGSEDELVKLTLAIVTVNGWNRFAISFRSEPGHYKPAKPATQKEQPAA